MDPSSPEQEPPPAADPAPGAEPGLEPCAAPPEEQVADPRLFGPAGAAPRKPRFGDLTEVLLERLGPRGEAVGTVGEYRLHLERGLVGERVLARVARRRRERIDAAIVRELAPSPWRVPPLCPHTADCGGCRFQELDYGVQLELKRRLASEQLAPLWSGRGPAPSLPALVPAPRRSHYRNKMEFTFGNRRWVELHDDGRATDFALGLHARGTWSKVLDVRHCALAFEGAERLLESVRNLAQRHGVPPYAFQDRSGQLRHLLLRRGQRTGELLVDLVTRELESPGLEELCAGLLERHPEITTLVQNVQGSPAMVSHGQHERVLSGPGHVHELLAGKTFRISANSFFQTNTEAAEGLVLAVRRALASALPSARGAGPARLLDLYCGGGTFALALADLFDEVLGLELVESAVADARRNAALNGLGGLRFERGDVRALLTGAIAGGPPTAVLVDPPRAGLHPDVVSELGRLRPPLLGYVACHLPSAARDLRPFLDAGYRILDLGLFDFFPHTPHLEGWFLLAAD